MLLTRENSDVFNSLDEIYLVFTSKKQISSIDYTVCIGHTKTMHSITSHLSLVILFANLTQRRCVLLRHILGFAVCLCYIKTMRSITSQLRFMYVTLRQCVRLRHIICLCVTQRQCILLCGYTVCQCHIKTMRSITSQLRLMYFS